MTRTQKILVVVLAILGGLLPVLVYGLGHSGLGAPVFADTRAMNSAQQFTQVVAGLVIKPTYMFISFVLIVLLIRQTAHEVAAMRWGLIAFLTGEIFCAVNFFIFKHASLPSEYLHSFGMVLAFGCFAYAFLEIVDRRLLHINHGRCAVNGLCETCSRNSPHYCAARRVTMLTITLTGLASFLPLAVSVSPISYLTDLFGFPYSYARFDFYQWYEARALPLTAIALFLTAFIPLLLPKGDPIPQWTKILFSAGMGALGFSIFRLTLASVFANNLVWFEFWEESTELMFIAAVSFLLWQFRDSLTSTAGAV